MRSLVVVVVVLALCALGCPESRTPDPQPKPTTSATASASVPTPQPSTSASAEPSVGLKGGWELSVTSELGGVNPDLFDTPEKKARVMYDHHASVDGDAVVVRQATLDKDFKLKLDAGAGDLEALILKIDWDEVKLRTAKEEPQEGGTVFHFAVTIGDKQLELATGNLDAYPDLAAIVTKLREVSGSPAS